MKKVLFTAKVDSHILAFHIPYLKYFKERGYEVHVASEGNSVIPYCDIKYDVSFGFNPFNNKVIKAYKEVKEIIANNCYEIIHTHTAIASVLTRIAYSFSKDHDSRIIYTAHGFHFIKGGRLIDWLIYFPVELFCGKITDDLILINNEDYDLACKYNIGKRRFLINGIGVNFDNFSHNDTVKNSKEKFVISYVAELNDNKNQLTLIKAVESLRYAIPNIQLNLVGEGVNKEKYNMYISDNNLQNHVSLLGFRNDVSTILEETDLYVSTSLREGLGINLIEAIASGVFSIAFNGRGHNEIIINDSNGLLIDRDQKSLEKAIEDRFLNYGKTRLTLEQSKTVSKYSVDNVMDQMKDIYEGR